MSGLPARAAALRAIDPLRFFGRVAAVRGALVEVEGLHGSIANGSRLLMHREDGEAIVGEVTALDREVAHCMAFADVQGLAVGARVDLVEPRSCLRPTAAWLGRVIDALGRPIDGRGPLAPGPVAMPLRADPPPPAERQKVGSRISTGVQAIDAFVPLCTGQRLGLFAGSGVGKSVLMSMIARWSACDVAVIGLIGERGREVQEFIEDQLGPEGLARSVVVVATSDAPALMRRQAAWATLAVAEYFRDGGAHVLCMMDSVTRFAMAQREIGLANGEPPATKGYPPSVFAELPRLLERAGPGLRGSGAISGLFTVLVDGGDHDEPIADAARGILDGHVVLDRTIAERGRYPAIDLLKSVSRSLPHALSPEQNDIRNGARALLSVAEDMGEMARLGAYRTGTDAGVDRALALGPVLEALVAQSPDDRGDGDIFAALATALQGGGDVATA